MVRLPYDRELPAHYVFLSFARGPRDGRLRSDGMRQDDLPCTGEELCSTIPTGRRHDEGLVGCLLDTLAHDRNMHKLQPKKQSVQQWHATWMRPSTLGLLYIALKHSQKGVAHAARQPTRSIYHVALAVFHHQASAR